jgi:hypothetical protein
VNALRKRLSWIACGWLCCQLSLLTAAPAALCAHPLEAADAVTCTCIHTGNAECPMHHPKSQKRGCECRNTTDPDAASLVSLIGPIAVLAATPHRLAPPAIAKSPVRPITQFIDFVAPPDGPPPRA